MNNPDTHQPENPNEFPEDKHRSHYNRLRAITAGTIGITAIVSCGPDSKEPTPTHSEFPTATIVTPETPTEVCSIDPEFYASDPECVEPTPTPKPLPPIPVAPLPPEHER